MCQCGVFEAITHLGFYTSKRAEATTFTFLLWITAYIVSSRLVSGMNGARCAECWIRVRLVVMLYEGNAPYVFGGIIDECECFFPDAHTSAHCTIHAMLVVEQP